MGNKRAIVEVVALVVGTVFALAGSMAFVLPATEPAWAADDSPTWAEIWTRSGGQVVAATETPERRALLAWRSAELAGDAAAVCFVDPRLGTVARGLIDKGGTLLVYEASLQARLLHPAIGSANLQQRGDYYLARPGRPVERCKLD